MSRHDIKTATKYQKQTAALLLELWLMIYEPLCEHDIVYCLYSESYMCLYSDICLYSLICRHSLHACVYVTIFVCIIYMHVYVHE